MLLKITGIDTFCIFIDLAEHAHIDRARPLQGPFATCYVGLEPLAEPFGKCDVSILVPISRPIDLSDNDRHIPKPTYV